MNSKNAIILFSFILLLGWSIWYWKNYPIEPLADATINKRCDEKTEKTAYCIGFGAGYNWAFDQMRQDEEAAKSFGSNK